MKQEPKRFINVQLKRGQLLGLQPSALREKLSTKKTPTTAMAFVKPLSKSNGETGKSRPFQGVMVLFLHEPNRDQHRSLMEIKAESS